MAKSYAENPHHSRFMDEKEIPEIASLTGGPGYVRGKHVS